MPPTLEEIGQAFQASGVPASAFHNSEQQPPVTPTPPSYDEVMLHELVTPPSYESLHLQPPPPPSYDEAMLPELVPPPSYESILLQTPQTYEMNVSSNIDRSFNSRPAGGAVFVGNNVVLNMGGDEVGQRRNPSSIVCPAIFLLFLAGLEICFFLFYKNNTVMASNAIVIVLVAVKIILLALDRWSPRSVTCSLPCRR